MNEAAPEIPVVTQKLLTGEVLGGTPAWLADLRWQRVSCTLQSTLVSSASRAHWLSVIQAIVKAVTERCGGAAEGSVFFHVPGRRFGDGLRKGSRLTVDVMFCRTPPDFAQRWRQALADHFAPGGPGRNFIVEVVGEPEERSYDAAAADTPQVPADGEICLEFLAPVPFEPEPGKPRTNIDGAGFVALLRRRIQLLFGVETDGSDGRELTALPCYWDYIEIAHPSTSQTGQVQKVKGCIGKLYLKGDFRSVLPLIVIGSELHAGSKRSNAQGYFRVHPAPAPYFSRLFPNRQGLAAACRDVLERYDNAALTLMETPGDRFDEEAFVSKLEGEIRAGAYAPSPNKAFLVEKKDGSERLIEQLQLRDLIVQQHLLRVLGPPFDRLFEDSSLGFRKGRSRHTAAKVIREAIAAGYGFVAEADIDDFFSTIDLSRLWQLLDVNLPVADHSVRDTLQKVLLNGYILNGVLERRRRGLAQGSPLSPLLANLYLDAFDESLDQAGVKLVRYADDFVILARTREDAERILVESRESLARLGLGVNAAKTAVRTVREGFQFLGMRFDDGEAREAGDEEEARRYKKPLYVVEPYLFIGVSGDAVEVRRRGQPLESIPLRRLSEIMVLGKAVFSTELLARCTALDIPLTLASGSGYYMTTVKPDSKRYYEICHQHSLAHQRLSDAERLVIAKEFAAGKILNYVPLFRQHYERGTAAAIRELEERAEQVRQAPDVETARGHEGAAAKQVYERLGNLVGDEAFHLRRRQRAAPDRMNALLNFGYYLLFCYVNATVRAMGLNPYLGFLHSPADNYESLTCDIEELFRSRIDRLILRVVNLKTIAAEDFELGDRGQRLKSEGSKKFLQQFAAEMARKESVDRLSLEEAIYAQVRTVYDWATRGNSLSFYAWKP